MSLKLGNGNINKSYLGNTEIKKAYLGNALIFDNSVTQYLLNFKGVNNDDLTISTANSWNTVNDVDIEFYFRYPVASPYSDARVLFCRTDNATSRFEVFATVGAGGNKKVYLRITSGGTELVNIISTNDVFIVGDVHKVTYKNSKLSVDDVEIFDNTSISSEVLSSGSAPIYINSRPYTGNSSDDYEVYPFFINGEEWKLLEGNGFNTVGESGTSATGSTDNAGGLTYWNSNVWKQR